MCRTPTLALWCDHVCWDGSSCLSGGVLGLTCLWHVGREVFRLVASLIPKHRYVRKKGCVQHRNSISESKYLSRHLKKIVYLFISFCNTKLKSLWKSDTGEIFNRNLILMAFYQKIVFISAQSKSCCLD